MFNNLNTNQQIMDGELWYDEDEYDDDYLDSSCPNCGIEYDEIDYEYQICHHCKHNNNTKPN